MRRVNDYLQIPWLEGGREPQTGVDCWGLVLLVYADRGIGLVDPWEHYRAAVESGDTTYSAFVPLGWHPIPWQELQALDVFITRHKGGEHIVIVGEEGWALTTHRGRGSFIRPLNKYRHAVRSCWRLTECG